MNKFIFQVSLLYLLVGLTIYSIALHADGYTDPFYLKFSSPPQRSLILGTSRAAQGVHPEVLNRVLGQNDFYNFSFTLKMSPYGPTYLEGVKKKIKKSTQSGVFILTVDPWAVSNEGPGPNNTANFKEANSCLSELAHLNHHPNIGYLVKCYNDPFINVFRNKSQSKMRLHTNGWLEIMIPMDSTSIAQRTIRRIAYYKNNKLPNFSFSSLRIKYLEKTIEYLKTRGSVFLVRLPVDPQMMEIDNLLIPNFDEVINQLSYKTQVPYLDLTSRNRDFIYTDGNHLSPKSGEYVSRIIGDWINMESRKQ